MFNLAQIISILKEATKQGNPYHDERGRFTVPERAVQPKGDIESRRQREATEQWRASKERIENLGRSYEYIDSPLPEVNLSHDIYDAALSNAQKAQAISRSSFSRYGRSILSVESGDALSQPDVSFYLCSPLGEEKASVPVAMKKYNISNPFGRFTANFIAVLGESGDVDASKKILEDTLQNYRSGQSTISWRLKINQITQKGEEQIVSFSPLRFGDARISYEVIFNDKKKTCKLLETTRLGRFVSKRNLSPFLKDAKTWDDIEKAVTARAQDTVSKWRKEPPSLDKEAMKNLESAEQDLMKFINKVEDERLYLIKTSHYYRKHAKDTLARLNATTDMDEYYRLADLWASFIRAEKRAYRRMKVLESKWFRKAQRALDFLLQAQAPVIDYLRTIPYAPSSDWRVADSRADAEFTALGITAVRSVWYGAFLWRRTLLALHSNLSPIQTDCYKYLKRRFGRSSILPRQTKREWYLAFRIFSESVHPSVLRRWARYKDINFAILPEGHREVYAELYGQYSARNNLAIFTLQTKRNAFIHELAHSLCFDSKRVARRLDSWALDRASSLGTPGLYTPPDYPPEVKMLSAGFFEPYIGIYLPDTARIGTNFHEIFPVGLDSMLFGGQRYYAVRYDMDYLKQIYAFLRGM